jgi:sugar lactone lactonase YvrE
MASKHQRLTPTRVRTLNGATNARENQNADSPSQEHRVVSDRNRRGASWALVFAVLLLVVSAVPVFADEPDVPPIGQVALAPSSLEGQGSWLPDADDVGEGMAELAQEEAARERELESPQAEQEREDSREAFARVDAAEARVLLEELFSDELAKLESDPARSLGAAESVRVVGETAAVVTEDGEGSLLDSGLPLRVEDENGELSKIDLSLEATPEGFETANAISDVQIGDSAAEPVEVGEGGVSITQLGAAETSTSQRFGEQSVFQFETQTDTDTLVAPMATGVEIFNLIRSEESPETFRFGIELPQGAELRPDGRGGAEVVRAGQVLALIPIPTAVDAQGTDVPVDFSIEGNTIALHVDHREGDYAMPILLDPEVVEDWINSNMSWHNGYNLNALSNGAWQWTSEPYGLIYFGTGNPCFYTCWGRGLYLTAPSRNYGANTYSHWTYSAPNADSYVWKVWLNPFWRDDHGCNREQYPQPHDYDGFYENGAFTVLQTNEAAKVGSVAIEGKGRGFIVGLSSGGGVNIPCWRDLYVGGAAVWLDDESQPQLTTSSTGQWMDSSPVRLNVSATDVGLGVRKFEAEATNKSGAMQKWETWHSCIGTYASRCPATWNLADPSQPQLAYDPAVLPEGIRTLNVTAFDATLRKSATTNGMTVRIDHAAPELKLSGTITEQASLGTEKPRYTIRVDAQDGEPKQDEDPTNDRSGVVSISEWVDGKKVNEYAPGCPTQSCSQFDEGAVEAAAYSNGKHTLLVKATDALGHIASKEMQFTLGDTQAPTLSVTGLPTESSTIPTRATYWEDFGAYGSGDGQLKYPADVAIDAQGDLWVADRLNNRLQKFRANGQFLAKSGSTGSGNGQFNSPSAIAIDPKGNVWVADKGNSRVQKFSSKGEYLFKFGSKGAGNGQFASGGPEGIAIDAKGNVWVTDTYAGRVQKFDENGNFLKVVGSKGSGVGQLGEPTGIDVGPNGNIWVADWQNNRVSVFNEAGEFVRQFGGEGSGDGQFKHPDTVAVGSKGDVWVGDQLNGRVQEFDQNGTYLGQFGSNGSGPGQFSFNFPFGLATDSKGSIWVADTLNNRIQRWLVPNTTLSGYLDPPSATATDGGFGVTSIAVKLTNEAGETEVVDQTSQSCGQGACPLGYEPEELDLSGEPSGTYLLTFAASDGAGNVRESSRVLNLDSAPPELELSGSLAESAGQPLTTSSAALAIAASDPDQGSDGVTQLNIERDGQLVASYPSDCSEDCSEVEASYAFMTAADGADRSVEPVAAASNGAIGELRRVSCAAASDCWAVGRTKYTATEQSEGKVAEELLEHWNGSEWQTTSIPKPAGATSLSLEDVDCASASVCLAVGSYNNGTNQPLVERWDGSKWTAGSTPVPAGFTRGYLYGVACGSPTDCWAHGRTQVGLYEQVVEGKVPVPFFAHWNGIEWQATSMPSPEGATGLSLEDIDCASASSCFAVGSYESETNQPLVERWDGSKWTTSATPLPAGFTKGFLNDVSCGSPTDCWAYGRTTQLTLYELAVEGKVPGPFFAHWNGSGWQAAPSAKAPDGSPTTVTSLSCASATACTAVGRYTNPHGEALPLAYTRDSAGWRFQPMPIKTEAANSSLEGVSCTAANECTSVGYSSVEESGPWQVLAEAETPDGGPHQITVEAVDALGNTASETIEIDVDPNSAAPPECNTEPELEPAQGVVTPTQARNSIEEALPAAVAPTDDTNVPLTGETVDPSYGPPSPNLETIGSLATGETSVTPEGGFTLDRSACITPAALTPAATEATVVNGDAAVFANTAPETDTVIRPTAMGATIIHSLRGPNAPDSFTWHVTVAAGEELIELPSGAVALVNTESPPAEGETLAPDPPEKSSYALADAAAQLENGEYELMRAATESSQEVIAVFAQPWVVLAQGGIVPALIEVVPDAETPNEFEIFVSVPPQVEEEPEFVTDAVASASSINGHCPPNTSPCGQFDVTRAANYAKYWGNEDHQGGWNRDHYPDWGANNCTNFTSQVLRAGRMKFMRAFEHGDGSWWYRNLMKNGQLYWNEHDQTDSWITANILPRHLWRFGLVHIDENQTWAWTAGNIIGYDWFDEAGTGNFDHLNFVVGRYDPANGPYEPLIANSSSPGHRYGAKRWAFVKASIEDAHGNEWTRVPLAVKHSKANLNEKRHAPENLYGPNGVFQG